METLPEHAYRLQHLPGAVSPDDMNEIPTLLPDKSADAIV